jgi:hypothetical protein
MTDDSRLDRLEAMVAELQRRLDAPLMHTMARAHRCPGCGGRKLLRFGNLQTSGYRGRLSPFRLQQGREFLSRMSAGSVEAYACRACRLVEWYVTSFDDVVVDGKDVIAIEAPDDPPIARGAYR